MARPPDELLTKVRALKAQRERELVRALQDDAAEPSVGTFRVDIDDETIKAALGGLGPAPDAPAGKESAAGTPPAGPPAPKGLMQRLQEAGSRFPVWILFFWTLLGLAALAATAWAWFVAIPRLVAWGLADVGFAMVPATVAIVLSAVMPVGAAFGVWQKAAQEYHAYMQGRVSVLEEARVTARLGAEAAMEQVTRGLGKIGTVLRLSQLELRNHHDDALHQKKRAFRHAVTATWLGFGLLLLGAVPLLLPSAGPLPSEPDTNALVVVAGVVVNAVGVMFYFVYRDSQAQATYYYDRQRFGHQVAMCYLLARGLDGEAQARAIQSLVVQIMDRQWAVARPRSKWDGTADGGALMQALRDPPGK